MRGQQTRRLDEEPEELNVALCDIRATVGQAEYVESIRILNHWIYPDIGSLNRPAKCFTSKPSQDIAVD